MKNNKKMVLLLSLIIILVLGIGATVAYIHMNTKPVTNSFEATEVSCDVVEKIKEKTKSEVKIANTGDVDAFIRAEVVVNWKKRVVDDEGNVSFEIYGKAPVAKSDDNNNNYDYIIEFETEQQTLADKGWVLGDDGFYYYTEAVEPGESTNVLVESCAAVSQNAPEGYYLSVEIIGSAIQADGIGTTQTGASGEIDRPAEIAWGVKVNTDSNGKAVSISAE